MLKFHKWQDVLLHLYTHQNEDKYITSLSKDLDITYSHTNKIIYELRDLKLVDLNREGRRQIVVPTKSGKEIGYNMMMIKKLIDY